MEKRAIKRGKSGYFAPSSLDSVSAAAASPLGVYLVTSGNPLPLWSQLPPVKPLCHFLSGRSFLQPPTSQCLMLLPFGFLALPSPK